MYPSIYASMHLCINWSMYQIWVYVMYSNVMQYYDMLCYVRTCAYTCTFTDTYTIIRIYIYIYICVRAHTHYINYTYTLSICYGCSDALRFDKHSWHRVPFSSWKFGAQQCISLGETGETSCNEMHGTVHGVKHCIVIGTLLVSICIPFVSRTFVIPTLEKLDMLRHQWIFVEMFMGPMLGEWVAQQFVQGAKKCCLICLICLLAARAHSAHIISWICERQRQIPPHSAFNGLVKNCVMPSWLDFAMPSVQFESFKSIKSEVLGFNAFNASAAAQPRQFHDLLRMFEYGGCPPGPSNLGMAGAAVNEFCAKLWWTYRFHQVSWFWQCTLLLALKECLEF